MNRTDYAFPFRIDPGSAQAAQSPYAVHVDEMIRQILLTTPGERADLPEFGCGLRRLLFAPNSDALQSTTQMLVSKASRSGSPDRSRCRQSRFRPAPGRLADPRPARTSCGNPVAAPNPGSGDLHRSHRPPRAVIAYVLVETQSLRQTQFW